MKTSNLRSAGFTLLELLIVIGIIGILMAVTISQFRGATDSARATTCKTNMRNLAIAVQNTVMADQWGHYPAAGSYKWVYYGVGKASYPTEKGWISWDQRQVNNKSKAGGAPVMFGSGDKELLRFAVTNGAIWRATGNSLETYHCPTHSALCMKMNKRNPGWSYVMNEVFGWDSKNGSGPLPAYAGKGVDSFNGDRVKRSNDYLYMNLEKVLLFAEIQGVDIPEHGVRANYNGSGNEGDSVLQYTKNERIGFNHKATSKRWAAHVAFADGHVEQLLYPRSGSVDELTKALCLGHSLSFNGSTYKDQSN